MSQIAGMTLGHREIRMNPLLWSLKYTRLDGQRFFLEGFQAKGETKQKSLFRTRFFLKRPLRDVSPRKVYYKPRQGGWSEIAVREALWFPCEHDYTSVAYTFHRPKNLEDFSRARIQKVIDESPYLKSRCQETMNITFKQIGKSFLYLRARTSPECGEGVDADVLFNDELDRGDPKAPASFAETLKSSEYGWIRDFSTPTIPGVGVHKSWELSDKKRWFNFCNKCGEANFLTMDHIVDVHPKKAIGYGRYDFQCESCKEVGKIDRMDGMWWPEITEIQCDYSGYHMSQLSYPWLSADDIMRSKRDYPFHSMFVNYILGEVYAGDNVLATRAHVEDCLNTGFKWRRPPVAGQGYKGVKVGIDWGDVSWAVVWMPHGGYRFILDVIQAEGLEEDENMTRFMDRLAAYKPSNIVADAGYGKDRIAKLKKKFGKHRVWSCFYPQMALESETTSRMVEANWQYNKRVVTVDRTMILKVMAASWRDREWIIPVMDDDIYETLIKHVTSLVSVKHFSDRSGEIRETIKSGGPDHLAHACAYAYLAGLKSGASLVMM